MATRNAEQLAELLGVKKSWVMSHLYELPHQRPGRHVRFTDEQVAEIQAMFERRPAGRSDDTGLSDRSHARLQRKHADTS